MVTDHCRYGNHATHQIHFHSQQNESSCIFSPCPPRSLQYDRGYCPFLAFFHSTRLRLLNFVNKTFWWSRFSFWTSRHLEFWPHRASAVMPPLCKSHQYQMSYFVGNNFHMVNQGSITSRCSGNEPALTPTKTGLEKAAEIEPTSSPNKLKRKYFQGTCLI